MKYSKILISAALASVSTVALAQAPAAPAAQPAAPTAANGAPASVRSEIMSDLKNAGYTNITVAPDSYLVQAKDKAGEPVALFVGPGSVTEVVMTGPMALPHANGAAHANAGIDNFATIPAGDALSSKLVGTDVYNKENKDIGAIKDLAFTPRGALKAYVVGVGSFLGMGEHYVAVRPSALTVTWDASAKKWHAVMDTNADSLKKAPEFKYPS